MTNMPMLERGLEHLKMLREDMSKLGAPDLHDLLRCWELMDRLWCGETHMRHLLEREETAGPATITAETSQSSTTRTGRSFSTRGTTLVLVSGDSPRSPTSCDSIRIRSPHHRPLSHWERGGRRLR